MKARVHRATLVTTALISALPLALTACAGPPITSPIDDEPVCPDFEVGSSHTKMFGSLRFPVQLSIKNGSTVAFKTTLHGLRTKADLASRVLLADDNETFTLEWAQCENERAPKPVEGSSREPKGIAKYECGNATVYKTEQLVTKKGDPASHKIVFATPPNAACWQGTAPPPPPPDAGAPDAAPSDADSGAPADADGGVSDGGTGDDGGATDAGTGDAGSTGSTDAGATDAGTGDAGTGKGASTSK